MELIEPYINMSLLALHTLACEGKLEEVSLVNTSEFVSKGIVYAKADSVTPDTSSWLGMHADIPFPGESIPKGSPVCSVFGKGISEGGCLFHLYERANEVYRELRSDDYHERRKD
jgi:predicted ATP-grasp superfamily ATP-dependent carboligase